ncbi:unnamed protein product [Schistocephalus solidus]|uniref:Uncharacterized protein n=1 Tax=Schistocephalus solidus TaxID=70667 RepID=A0A183TM54_SCHSO|nr:unnamed protein product [Schistocephalus solidus]
MRPTFKLYKRVLASASATVRDLDSDALKARGGGDQHGAYQMTLPVTSFWAIELTPQSTRGRKKAERKPHGLQVQKQPLAETLSSAAPVPLLTLATLKSVLDTAAARGAGDDPKAHLLTVFFCDLDMLTTDSGEESCFEMNKAQNCHPDVCSTTLSAAPSWTDEAIEASERVLNEIRQIVEGEELDNPIVGSADESDGRKRARMELINRLEALNRSQTAATP